MTRYIIYFEPIDVDADNLDDAENQYRNGLVTGIYHMIPKILKIIPAEFIFDCEPKKEKIA